MKSPFPGLDPYLEAFWGNVHTRMMTYIGDQLQSQLPAGLWTRVEESVTIDAAGDQSRVYPDVHISDEQAGNSLWKEDAGGVAVAKPEVIIDEERTERHIEIVDTTSGGKVVTAIEVLSPGNKIGVHNREQYRSKQQSFLRAGVNLVEIDLIRRGAYILSAPDDKLSEPDSCRISVYRAVSIPREWELYPIDLRKPVPAFRVPLRRGDVDAVLDLQAVLDQCYRNGGYHLGIDYTQAPDPNLPDADHPWLDQLLADAGLRPRS